MTQQPYKIIFLDVDGVLNRTSGPSFLTVPGLMMAPPFIVERNIVEYFVETISKYPDIRVVVSSTWRFHCDSPEMFSDATGVPHRLLHPDWRLQTLGGEDRPEDVKQWLTLHPEITEYVIIDDTKYAFTLVLQREPIFVRTREDRGLTQQNLHQALTILGLDPRK